MYSKILSIECDHIIFDKKFWYMDIIIWKMFLLQIMIFEWGKRLTISSIKKKFSKDLSVKMFSLFLSNKFSNLYWLTTFWANEFLLISNFWLLSKNFFSEKNFLLSSIKTLLIIAVSPPLGIVFFPEHKILSIRVDPDLGKPIIKIGLIFFDTFFSDEKLNFFISFGISLIQ